MSEAVQKPLTLLIVEDDPGDFGLIRAQIRLSGLERSDHPGWVIWAKSLAEGIEAARHHKPDLVLLDLSLPDSRGLATVLAMRAALPNIPLVVLTGQDDHQLADLALQSGAQDYLVKGQFEPDTLGRTVRYAQVREALESRLRRLAHRNQAVLDAVAEGIAGIDHEGRIIFINPAALQMLGYGEAELLGANFHDLVHANTPCEGVAESCEVMRAMATTAGSKKNLRGETFYAGKQGHLFPVEYTFAIVENDLPMDLFVLAFRDMTERRQTEIRLREAASVFEYSSDGIFICDRLNRIQRVNRAFTVITGYAPEDVIGKNPSILQSGRHDIHFYIALWYELLENNHWAGEMWNRHKDGTLYPEWLSITMIRDAQDGIAGFIAQFNDISSHKRVEDETRHRGNYDPLTGLPNRYLLLERLEMALREARRYQRQVALLFVDLDFFKTVNDTLGHSAGDHVLRDVAKRLTACIRETDTAARQGGDEFIVVLQDIEDDQSVAQIAGKIVNTLSDPFVIGRNAVYIGASIGIAISPQQGQDVVTLMDQYKTEQFLLVKNIP